MATLPNYGRRIVVKFYATRRSAYIRPGTIAQIKDQLDQVYSKSLQIVSLFQYRESYAIGAMLDICMLFTGHPSLIENFNCQTIQLAMATKLNKFMKTQLGHHTKISTAGLRTPNVIM